MCFFVIFYDLILFMAEINFVTSGIVFRSFWIKNIHNHTGHEYFMESILGV